MATDEIFRKIFTNEVVCLGRHPSLHEGSQIQNWRSVFQSVQRYIPWK